MAELRCPVCRYKFDEAQPHPPVVRSPSPKDGLQIRKEPLEVAADEDGIWGQIDRHLKENGLARFVSSFNRVNKKAHEFVGLLFQEMGAACSMRWRLSLELHPPIFCANKQPIGFNSASLQTFAKSGRALEVGRKRVDL